MSRPLPAIVQRHAQWVLDFLENKLSCNAPVREQRTQLEAFRKWCFARGLMGQTEVGEEEFWFVRWDLVLAIGEEFSLEEADQKYRVEFIGMVEGMVAAMNAFDPWLKQNQLKWGGRS